MNREIYKLQHTQRECNKWWLTWSADQRAKRELERKQFIRDLILTAIIIGGIVAIHFLTGEV